MEQNYIIYHSIYTTFCFAEEITFDSLKEEETKKFLVDVNISVRKIKDCLSNNDTEAQSMSVQAIPFVHWVVMH